MGTGQAFAIFDLTKMLNEMDIKVGLFRRQSLHASELQDHDVVFLGSPGRNGLLDRNQTSHAFRFSYGTNTRTLGR